MTGGKNTMNTKNRIKAFLTAAVMAANEAKKWSMIGIIISLIVWVLYFVFFGGLAALGIFSSMAG